MSSGERPGTRLRRASPSPRPAGRTLVPGSTPLLDLQRRAGNAAVSALVASRPTVGRPTVGRDTTRSEVALAAPPLAGPLVQRDDTTTKDGRRPGELWPWGPITTRKSVQHDLASFIHWIRVVEQAYGPDKQAVLQRLRRLYYSKHSGKAGAKFDAVIEEQAGAGNRSDAPLDSLRIGTITLDGLFETDTVRTLTGEILDPAHILAALDVRQSGVTTKAEAGAALYDTPWTGIVTWTGDLASWFVEWSQQIRALMAAQPPPETEPATEAGPVSEQGPGPIGDTKLWESVGASKVSKADLLGDMDAQVLAARSIRRSTPESIRAEKRIVRDANIGLELTKPVSKLLEEYYGFAMGRDKPTEAEGRFPLFVRSAVPSIPHKPVAGVSGTKGSVELASAAEDAIFVAIKNTASLFINEGTSDKSDPVATYPSRLRDIAKRFTTFLSTGLRSGDAPWP